jgi:hypothetical protein
MNFFSAEISKILSICLRYRIDELSLTELSEIPVNGFRKISNDDLTEAHYSVAASTKKETKEAILKYNSRYGDKLSIRKTK